MVEHQVYLHPMHITCNRTMIIPAVSTQLFYNIKVLETMWSYVRCSAGIRMVFMCI